MIAHTARVRLTRTVDGQRLDIPPGFTLAGDEAILRSEGDRLVIEAAPPPSAPGSLLALIDGLDEIAEDWPEIADPPPDDVPS